MKKLLFIPLAATLALTSCGGGEDAIEELQHEAEMVAEDGANDIFEYNDALLSEVTLIEVEFAKIYDLDEQDIPADEFASEVEKSLKVVADVRKNLSNIDAYGAGGEGFLQAVKDYAAESKIVMELYLDYSDLLAIPDVDWSDDELNDFIDVFEPAENAHGDAYDNISTQQDVFASMNGTSVEEDAAFDAQEIYDESKEK